MRDMNDTILALLGALAIYGLTNLAMPRGTDDEATIQVEDSIDLRQANDFPDDAPPAV